MEKTKFYKGQLCTWDGSEGVIVTTESKAVSGCPIVFAFDLGFNYFTADGRVTPNSPISLRPVGEARRGLTEWQRKQLNRELSKLAKEDYSDIVDLIESILSQPEPPKWEPKENEVVLVWDSDNCAWVRVRFVHMDGDKICFSLVGQ